MCLSVCILWKKCLFCSSAHFLIRFFVFWFWVIWAAYIFCILTPSWSYHFANILFLLVGCLFILLMISFAVQNLVIRSHLFTFALVSFALGKGSKQILWWFMPKSIRSMFSSRSFMVSSLSFRSLIHFVFIFYMLWENVLISFFYM